MRRGLIAIIFIALLQACAQTSALKAFHSARFTTYDGDWSGVMKNTAAVQTFNNLTFNCDEFSESFFVRVHNGVVSGYLEADENYSFRTQLSTNGVFKTVIPIDSFYRYKKDISVEPSSIALLLSGNLSPDVLRGQFVIGDKRMSLNGCSTNVEYIAL